MTKQPVMGDYKDSNAKLQNLVFKEKCDRKILSRYLFVEFDADVLTKIFEYLLILCISVEYIYLPCHKQSFPAIFKAMRFP
jgi:hypothetical protein